MPKVSQIFLNSHRLTCIFAHARNFIASVYAIEIKNILLDSLFTIVINTYLMEFSIYAHYIGSLLNAIALDFWQRHH